MEGLGKLGPAQLHKGCLGTQDPGFGSSSSLTNTIEVHKIKYHLSLNSSYILPYLDGLRSIR